MPDLGEVFISYSWDSEEHIASVLALSNRLRADGIDCVLDQYEVSPSEGWPRWMDRKITAAGLVLVICTETYFARVMGYEEPNKGLGVKWEGNLVYQHLYNAGANNQKFVPVLVKDEDKGFIPVPLQGASYFTVDTELGYQRLYNRVLGRPPAEKPPLGAKKPLPKKEVKTDISMFISSPIDVDVWNAAKWRATAFAVIPNQPPILGIAFLNRGPAAEIFKNWQKRYGDWDEREELRVSIIEGPVPNEHPGYTVHIGVEYENVMARFKSAGLSVADQHIFATVTRMNRMTPAADSPHLSRFKDAYAKAGEYLLVPATCNPDGSNLHIAPSMGIRKHLIHFRHTSEIGSNDPDEIVLRTGEQDRPLTDYGHTILGQKGARRSDKSKE